jgi:CBS domain-containing protein
MRIEDAMSSPPWTVRAETPLKVAAEIMAAQHVSGLPVVDADDRPVGVVSEADILRKERAPSRRRRGLRRLLGRRNAAAPTEWLAAGEAMTRPAITVRAEASVDVARALMSKYDVERLPVVDRVNQVVGVISRADLVRIAVD